MTIYDIKSVKKGRNFKRFSFYISSKFNVFIFMGYWWAIKTFRYFISKRGL